VCVYPLSRRFKVAVSVAAALVVVAGVVLFVTWSGDVSPLLEFVGVMVNFAALMAAVILGWGGFQAAARQAEDSRRATVLAYRPLLVPVHESAGPSDNAGPRQFYPAMDGVSTNKVNGGTRTLRVTERLSLQGRTTKHVRQAWVYLRNVGQGPAVLDKVTMWNALGHRGELAGSGSIGSGDFELFVGDLEPVMSADDVAFVRERHDLESHWSPLEPDRIYWLEVTYSDVFASQPLRRLQAWFDPTGRGHWRVVSKLSDPQT
jgi:hypothetical protein